MKKIISLVTASALLIPSLSLASTNQAGTKLISKLTHGQIKVIKQFDAPMNLTGYVVTAPNGQQTIFYTDQKGQYLITGTIITQNGQNLTQKYTNQFILPARAKSAYSNLHTTHTITIGKDSAPHKMYIIWDPNCSACHVLYGALKTFIDSGKVQVRIIPVAIRGPSSKTKSAQILAAKTNAKAVTLINTDEAKFKLDPQKGIESGGIKGIQKNKDNASAFNKVNENTKFFMHNKFMGTPVILYKNKQGEAKMVPGFAGKAALAQMLNDVSKHW